MGMKNSFTATLENLLTRRFGGTAGGAVDPYVTGYFFMWFSHLPSGLKAYLENEPVAGIDSIDSTKKLLTATNIGFTPPGGTMSVIEYTGLGGVKWGVPGNSDYGNTLSMRFIELNKTPIFSVFHSWAKMIRDYRTGATDLIDGNQGEGYSKRTYGGTCYYWTTAPDCETVEFYACYDGVFPTKDPMDSFSSDLGTTDKVEIDMDFHVDNTWREPWVLANINKLKDPIVKAKATFKEYGEKLSV